MYEVVMVNHKLQWELLDDGDAKNISYSCRQQANLAQGKDTTTCKEQSHVCSVSLSTFGHITSMPWMQQ